MRTIYPTYFERLMQKFSAARPTNAQGKALSYSNAKNALKEPVREEPYRSAAGQNWPNVQGTGIATPSKRTNPNVRLTVRQIMGI